MGGNSHISFNNVRECNVYADRLKLMRSAPISIIIQDAIVAHGRMRYAPITGRSEVREYLTREAGTVRLNRRVSALRRAAFQLRATQHGAVDARDPRAVKGGYQSHKPSSPRCTCGSCEYRRQGCSGSHTPRIDRQAEASIGIIAA